MALKVNANKDPITLSAIHEIEDEEQSEEEEGKTE